MQSILDITSASMPYGGTIAKLRVLVKNSTNRHVVYFFCSHYDLQNALKEDAWYVENKIKTYYGGYGQYAFLKHAYRVSKIIKEEGVTLVNFYFNAETPLVFLLKTLNPKVKFVRSFVGYLRLNGFKKSILNASIKKLDAVIYISEYIRRCYIQDYPVLSRINSRIIYNCPVNFYSSKKSQGERTLITYVGGINEHKNVPLLIDTMNVVVNKYRRKDIKLTIVGDGNRELVLGKIIEYNLTENVIILGYRKDIPEILDDTKVYLHAATNEGFGISVVEAMYMKCPCLVANASALPELIDDSCGFILPIDDPEIWAEKLLLLEDNEDLRSRFGEASYNRANRMFSINKFVSQHDEYHNIIVERN